MSFPKCSGAQRELARARRCHRGRGHVGRDRISIPHALSIEGPILETNMELVSRRTLESRKASWAMRHALDSGGCGGRTNYNCMLVAFWTNFILKGEIEHIPLPDNSVDVIISNCVINLSADKDRALNEAFRVLKPGGRFAVSDVVTRGEMKTEIRQSVLLWVGCVAGALQEDEYRNKLTTAGFEQIDDTSLLRPNLLQLSAEAKSKAGTNSCHEGTLQRLVFVYGQFGAFDHGRGTDEFEGWAHFHGL